MVSNRLKGGPGRVLLNGVIMSTRTVGVATAKLVTTRFLLAAFGTESFGVFFAVSSIALLSGFLTSALQAVSLRALSLEGPRKGDMNLVFNSLLGMHIISSMVMLGLGGLVGLWLINSVMVIPDDLLGSAEFTLLCMLAAAVFGNIFAVYEAFLQAKDQFGVFAFLDVLRTWLLVPASFWLSYQDGDRLKIYAAIVAFLTTGGLFAAALYTIRAYPETRPNPRYFFNFQFMRQHGSIASWSLIGSVATVTRTQGMTILVNVIGGPSANAAFAIANQITGALRQFADTIRTILAPRIYGKEALGQRREMMGYVFAVCKASMLVMLIVALPLIAELPVVLQLWLGKVDPTITLTSALLLISLIVDQSSAGTALAHMALGRIARYQLIAGGMSLMMLPVGYAIAQISGRFIDLLFVLVAFSVLISVTRVVLLQPQIERALHGWVRETLLPTACAVLPPSLFAIVLVEILPPGIPRLILSTVGGVLVSMVSAYLFGLSPVEREKLRSVFVRRTQTE